MKRVLLSALSVILLGGQAVAQENGTETFVVGRIGLSRDGAVYHLAEVFQQRGRWILPDVGYIDFADGGQYREFFVGAGAVLYKSKHILVIGEGYLNVPSGPRADGAAYFLPWSYVGYTITPKLAGEAVYFPYIPLNGNGRVQHVLERAKLEYDLGRVKIGGGYGAYQFGDGPWTNRPFLTTTLKFGRYGDLEVWLQRMPSDDAQIQLRYMKIVR